VRIKWFVVYHALFPSEEFFRFLFYAGQLLIGFGATPLFTLAVTYLDENVKQASSSLYHGLYSCHLFLVVFVFSLFNLCLSTSFNLTGHVLNKVIIKT